MQIAVVGTGMAGLACAGGLRAFGHDLTMFEKSLTPGGRMSTRRVVTADVEASFDHGAQYFTTRDPKFRDLVQTWYAAGAAAPWQSAGADAWVGTPGMNAPAKAMAKDIDIRWLSPIESLERIGSAWQVAGNAFDAVIVAIPAEQAAPMLRPWCSDMAVRASAAVSSPCWTVMASFAQRLPIEPDVVRETGTIRWAARNSAKPGRIGPESWVIQASPAWSRKYLEWEPGLVIEPLLAALASHAGTVLPQPMSATAHRWRYAQSGADGAGMLWDPALKLGVCGDWLIGPRVEAAWLSGSHLAETVGSAPL